MNRRQENTELSSTRISRAWLAALVGMVLLLVALVFVAQNGDDVAVEFLAWEGTISLGLALLLAAVTGGLIVFSLGAARMVQLRRAFRRSQESQRADDEVELDRAEQEERETPDAPGGEPGEAPERQDEHVSSPRAAE